MLNFLYGKPKIFFWYCKDTVNRSHENQGLPVFPSFLEVWSEPEVFENVNSGQNLKCLIFMPQIFLLRKLLKYS